MNTIMDFESQYRKALAGGFQRIIEFLAECHRQEKRLDEEEKGIHMPRRRGGWRKR